MSAAIDFLKASAFPAAEDPAFGGGRALDAVWQSPDRRLKARHRIVLMFLGSQANFRGGFLEARKVSQRAVAASTGQSIATVARALRDLVAWGFLEASENSRSYRAGQTYTQMRVENSYALTPALFDAYRPIAEAERARRAELRRAKAAAALPPPELDVPLPGDADAPPSALVELQAPPRNLSEHQAPQSSPARTPLSSSLAPNARVITCEAAAPSPQEEDEARELLRVYGRRFSKLTTGAMRASFVADYAANGAPRAAVERALEQLAAHPEARRHVLSPNAVWFSEKILREARAWEVSVADTMVDLARRGRIRSAADVAEFGRSLGSAYDREWFEAWSQPFREQFLSRDGGCKEGGHHDFSAG